MVGVVLLLFSHFCRSNQTTGRVEIADGLKEHAEELMKQAHLVVEHGWRPRFFMIDKYRSSLVAIRRGRLFFHLSLLFSEADSFSVSRCYYSHLPIPCHAGQCFLAYVTVQNPFLAQAILRWERDGGAPGEQQVRPTLDLRRKHQLLWAVREIQRCRHLEQWQQYLDQFRLRLDYITEGSQTSSDTLWDYFEANWFCDQWRGINHLLFARLRSLT
jgi:hypothetical protein